MASNGILQYAKTGKCRICYRVRKTDSQVMPVGQVCHGYATGHIWECIDENECMNAAKKKIEVNHMDKTLIEMAINYYRA